MDTTFGTIIYINQQNSKLVIRLKGGWIVETTYPRFMLAKLEQGQQVQVRFRK